MAFSTLSPSTEEPALPPAPRERPPTAIHTQTHITPLLALVLAAGTPRLSIAFGGAIEPFCSSGAARSAETILIIHRSPSRDLRPESTFSENEGLR